MVKSDKTITTTGKMRSALADAMVKVSKGLLSGTDGKSLIGLSNQITQSIAVELKHQNMEVGLGHEAKVLGALNIG